MMTAGPIRVLCIAAIVSLNVQVLPCPAGLWNSQGLAGTMLGDSAAYIDLSPHSTPAALCKSSTDGLPQGTLECGRCDVCFPAVQPDRFSFGPYVASTHTASMHDASLHSLHCLFTV